MVVSTAPHLRQSYLLWRRFSLPIDGGTRDAYAVPNYVADQLNSAYTIMVTSMVMNLWCILFALAFFWLLKRHDNKPHIVSISLWNKRASLTDSFLELIQPSTDRKGHWRQWWIYPAIFVILICWIGQNVLSIIVPPYINIGNAAPVNPAAIYAPSNVDKSHAARAEVFSLDVPAALRAVGSAQVASKDVLSKVFTSQTDAAFSSSSSTPTTAISYNYTISGSDLGLQYYPTLELSVTGSCRTEYNWLISSEVDESLGGGGYTTDTYAIFGNNKTTISLNIFDGPAPVAFFYTNPDDPPNGPPGNRTWAAFISSVDRLSFTPGTDPFYLTSPLDSGNNTDSEGLADTNHVVRPKRPALSCWQLDEWTYKGAKSTITGLNSTMLPGLDLSSGMQIILARYLGNPKVVDIGKQLGLSNLLSSTTSLGNIFDAGGSGAFSDLQRLVLAAYIGSTNTLTDLTLYPQSSSPPPDEAQAATEDGKPILANLALDDNGNRREGVAQFVIYSSEISTLSVKALIIIPALSLVFWLLALGLLTWSPLSKVNALDVTVLHQTLEEKLPGARPHFEPAAGGRGRGKARSWIGKFICLYFFHPLSWRFNGDRMLIPMDDTVHRDDPRVVGLREVSSQDEEAGAANSGRNGVGTNGDKGAPRQVSSRVEEVGKEEK